MYRRTRSRRCHPIAPAALALTAVALASAHRLSGQEIRPWDPDTCYDVAGNERECTASEDLRKCAERADDAEFLCKESAEGWWEKSLCTLGSIADDTEGALDFWKDIVAE